MKRIIVCCDGTWNSDDDGTVPTNVRKLGRLIVQRDDRGIWQKVFYRRGVGTRYGNATSHDATRLRRTLDRVGGGAFGWGLDANILACYGDVVRVYEPDDELWLFGFSRGAYTARSLAGLIRNCGILRREYEVLIDLAMNLYRARDPLSHPNSPRSIEFRAKYSHEVESIHFIGVWDTVGARGLPNAFGPFSAIWNRRYRFHDVDLSSRVEHAYHAIAIDEQRRAFAPTIWEWKAPNDAGSDERQRGRPGSETGSDDAGGRPGSNVPTHRRPNVEQVWFPGVHSDIGGGYAEAGLSDIALAWMLDKARACGLSFDDERIAEELAPDPLAPLHDSRWFIHKLLPFAAVQERAITAAFRQFIHVAAVTRMERIAEYDPANLQVAIEGQVPVTPRNPDTPGAGAAQVPAPPSDRW